MRRSLTAAVALLLAASLGLAGCSGDGKKSAKAAATPTSAATQQQKVDCSKLKIDTDSKSLPTIGQPSSNKAPAITWVKGAKAPTNLTVKTIKAGSGAAVAADSNVAANYSGWKWDSATTFDSSFERGSATRFGLNGVIDGWRCGLLGHKVGDVLEISIPGKLAYGDKPANPQAPAGTLVFYVELTDALTTAQISAASKDATLVEGATEELEKNGITVTGKLGQAPSITIKAGISAPTSAKLITLASGNGEKLTDTDTALGYMAMATWDGNKRSSWTESSPQPVQMSVSQIKQLVDLSGIPVGSRVVIILPPQASSQGGQTTPASVYVFDIAAK